MRNLLLVFGALLVMAGMVSTNLWRNLRTERMAHAELSTQLAAARTVSSVPAPPTQSIAVPPPAPMPDCPADAAPPASTTATATPPAQSVGSSLAVALDLSSALATTGWQDLAMDPEYRKAQLTMTRMKLVRMNPGLAEALGLSDAEASHLFDVMAESQFNSTAAISNPTTAVEEALRRASGADDPVRATLGDARFAQLQDYQRNTRPALNTAANLGRTLTSAGQPMSDSQYRALTAALLAEQQRQRQEPEVPRSTPNSGGLRITADMLLENSRLQDDTNRRILAAAEASLDPAQLRTLQEQFDQQSAARRRTIDTARDFRYAPPQLPDQRATK